MLQSVVFQRKDKWTMKQMRDFLTKNNIAPLGGLTAKGVDKKETQYRWRVLDPHRFTRFITHIIDHETAHGIGKQSLPKRVYLIIGL